MDFPWILQMDMSELLSRKILVKTKVPDPWSHQGTGSINRESPGSPNRESKQGVTREYKRGVTREFN